MRSTAALILAVVLSIGICLGQGAALPPSEIGSGIISAGYGAQGNARMFSNLLDWEVWLGQCLRQLASDSAAEAAGSADSCLARARVLDIHLPALSRLLGEEAAKLEKSGRGPLAHRYYGLALQANPASLKAIMDEMRARQGGGSGTGLAIQNASQALGYFRVSLRAASHMALWGSLLLMAWGSLFLLYSAIRRFPRLTHVLSERMPRKLPSRLRTLYSGIVVTAFLLTAGSLSLPLAAVILASASAAFARTKERILMAISVLFVLAASLGLSLSHRMMDVSGRGYLGLLDRANHSPWGRSLEAELLCAQEERPDDLKPLFGMALLAGRSGRHQIASDRYLALLDSRPGHAPALNNLGNIMFRQGLLDSAQSLYQRALAAEPRLAVAHYNLGQVHLRSLRFPEGKRELERASELDPGQIGLRSSQAGGGLALDVLIANRVLWSSVWGGWSMLEGFDRAEASALSGPWTWLPAAGGLALAVIFVILLALYRGFKPDEGCRACGRPICARCGGEERQYCPTCAEKVFAAQSPDIQDKVVKSLRPLAARRRLLRAAASNVLGPGSAWVLSGRLFAGWLWALMWGVVYATWRSWALGLYPGSALPYLGMGGWTLAVLAAMLYLMSWLALAALREE